MALGCVNARGVPLEVGIQEEPPSRRKTEGMGGLCPSHGQHKRPAVLIKDLRKHRKYAQAKQFSRKRAHFGMKMKEALGRGLELRDKAVRSADWQSDTDGEVEMVRV